MNDDAIDDAMPILRREQARMVDLIQSSGEDAAIVRQLAVRRIVYLRQAIDALGRSRVEMLRNEEE